MLAKNAGELVERCCKQADGLLGKEELKDAFISYVFSTYQDEVVARYGWEAFYEHLEQIALVNCRKDFDQAVEEWYARKNKQRIRKTCYHDVLFSLVKETVATCRPDSREQLVNELTRVLTSSDGYMSKWKTRRKRTLANYYSHLGRMGIRSYGDIIALADAWLMEHPSAFDKEHQQYLALPSRRGRPNNVELLSLLRKVHEMKRSLSLREKERIRKIYYYYRSSLTALEMIEKFKLYISSKSERQENEPPVDDPSPQVG